MLSIQVLVIKIQLKNKNERLTIKLYKVKIDAKLNYLYNIITNQDLLKLFKNPGPL